MNHTSFTLGTRVEAITDQEPLVPVYNSLAKPKQLRVDRHTTKLLLFSYDVTYEPGAKTRCNYGLRHPPQHIYAEIMPADSDTTADTPIDTVHIMRGYANSWDTSVVNEVMETEPEATENRATQVAVTAADMHDDVDTEETEIVDGDTGFAFEEDMEIHIRQLLQAAERPESSKKD